MVPSSREILEAASVSLDAALELILRPRVDLAALSGVLHVCALHDAGGADDAPLRNILMGAAAPKSLSDWLVLCSVRARASVVISSGASVRAEGGRPFEIFGAPFSDAARALRARVGIEARGALLLMTRGEQPLEPDWTIFDDAAGGAGVGESAGAGESAGERAGDSEDECAGGAARRLDAPVVFRPVLLLPDDATRERVLARFASAARAAPLCLTGAELRKGGGCNIDSCGGFEDLSIGTLLSFLRTAASGGDESPLLPRCLSADAKHLISVESGPSVTRQFYESPDCPIDWLMLSTHSGPICGEALGEAVMRRSAVDCLFERVAMGAARGDRGNAVDGVDPGVWKFELFRRKR